MNFTGGKRMFTEKMEEYIKKYHLDVIVMFCCIAILSSVTFRIVYKQAYMGSDYSAHMHTAMNLDALLKNVRPGWMWGVRIFYLVSHFFVKSMTPELACTIFTTIVNICVFLCDRYVLKLEKVKCADVFALILCFVTAVYYPRFSSNIYLGHGGPVTWHNPTNMMVKPFMILSMVIIIGICDKIRKNEKSAGRELFILSILLLVGVVCKPSFYQGIVPALGSYMVVMLIYNKGRGFLEYVKLCASFVPATIVVIIQFIVSMYMEKDAGGVGIKWGATCFYTNNPYKSLVIVLLFPMLYTLLNFKKQYGKTETHILWFFVLFAWLERMLLFEDGPKIADGNFEWAADLSYAMVWLYQVKDYALDLQGGKNLKEVLSWKNVFLMGILLLHLISGVIYCRQLLYISWCLL